MTRIGGIGSGGTVHGSGGVGPQDEIQPVKPGTQQEPEAIHGQEALEGPEALKDSAELTGPEAQQKADSLEREKKAMQQNAIERMGEEAMKAEAKKTQAHNDYDASQTGPLDPAGKKSETRFDYDVHDPQPVPHRRKDGSYQRYNVTDKKWE